GVGGCPATLIRGPCSAVVARAAQPNHKGKPSLSLPRGRRGDPCPLPLPPPSSSFLPPPLPLPLPLIGGRGGKGEEEEEEEEEGDDDVDIINKQGPRPAYIVGRPILDLALADPSTSSSGTAPRRATNMAAAAGNAAVVPKFGSWDAENIGYTVFFDKVRDNKPAPNKPPGAAAAGGGGGGYDFDPYEHYESLSRKVPSRPPSSHGQQRHHQPAPRQQAPGAGGGAYDFDPYEHYDSSSLSGAGRNLPSRPPSSHGHGYDYDYDYDPYERYENLSARNAPSSRPPATHGHHGHAPPQHHRPGPALHQQQQQQYHQQQPGGHGYHRRTGSSGSAAGSEASSRGSKFSPPRPYQPRYSGNTNLPHQGAGHGHAQYHHQQQHGAPRAASASPSPPRHRPPAPAPPRRANGNPPKPSGAVPRFGVWDEQNAAVAAQGFTVQFEKVKRHREEARTAPAPPPPPPKLLPTSPGRDHRAAAGARRHGPGKRKAERRSFMSRVYRCMFPRVRE
ncbi:hypothetical protein U9M48_025408, partial [Paspalum notatum var. saurae]